MNLEEIKKRAEEVKKTFDTNCEYHLADQILALVTEVEIRDYKLKKLKLDCGSSSCGYVDRSKPLGMRANGPCRCHVLQKESHQADEVLVKLTAANKILRDKIEVAFDLTEEKYLEFLDEPTIFAEYSARGRLIYEMKYEIAKAIAAADKAQK